MEELAKACNGAHEASGAETVKHLFHAHRGIPARRGLLRNASCDGSRRQVNRIEHEFIRMFGLDIVSLEHMVGEMLQVERDDRLRSGPDGRSEHVRISRIGQVETDFEVLESFDDAVGNRIAHECTCTREVNCTEIRPSLEDAGEAFVEDALRPSRSHDSRVRDANKQVTKRSRMKDTSVVDDDERHALSTRARVSRLRR